jgi:hypothetical protein
MKEVHDKMGAVRATINQMVTSMQDSMSTQIAKPSGKLSCTVLYDHLPLPSFPTVFTTLQPPQYLIPSQSRPYSNTIAACSPAAFATSSIPEPPGTLNPITNVSPDLISHFPTATIAKSHGTFNPIANTSAHLRPPLHPLHANSTSSNCQRAQSKQLPAQGLLIPNVPIRLSDGSHSQKSNSWRIIVDH